MKEIEEKIDDGKNEVEVKWRKRNNKRRNKEEKTLSIVYNFKSDDLT